MGVCSNRTQRLSNSAGERKWEARSGEQGGSHLLVPGGAGHPARGEPGTPRDSPNFPSFIIKTQRSEGWRWEIYNLLAVNRALSGDDAPACLKHPENKVPTIYIFRIGASIRSRLYCVYKIRSFVRGMTSSDP